MERHGHTVSYDQHIDDTLLVSDGCTYFQFQSAPVGKFTDQRKALQNRPQNAHLLHSAHERGGFLACCLLVAPSGAANESGKRQAEGEGRGASSWTSSFQGLLTDLDTSRVSLALIFNIALRRLEIMTVHIRIRQQIKQI
jgi:hypothetical protein